MVEKAVTSTLTCFIAGMVSDANFPMTRSFSPSISATPEMICGEFVQCIGSESVRTSVADQTLKYGSIMISG